jgi:1-acyl-sn-glycerol-3-phosphate acyltransferase
MLGNMRSLGLRGFGRSASTICAQVRNIGDMQYLRSKTFDTVWFLWTALFVPTVPILILFGSPTRYVRALAVVWTQGTLILLRGVVGLKYLQRRRENIPRQPCVIICNHQSPWETIAFIAHFPNIAIVAKRELLRIPIFGWFVKAFPMIVIDRNAGFKALRQMTRECRTALSEGRSVLIFPEGTRKRVSDPVIFKRGVEFVYSQLDVPVLPVAVNSGVFWGPERPVKQNGTITVSYLPPIMPGLSPKEFKREAQKSLQDEKGRLVTESRDNAPRSYPDDRTLPYRVPPPTPP